MPAGIKCWEKHVMETRLRIERLEEAECRSGVMRHREETASRNWAVCRKPSRGRVQTRSDQSLREDRAVCRPAGRGKVEAVQ